MKEKERNDEPQKGVYALVSGAGSVAIKDGLVSAIMIEKAKFPIRNIALRGDETTYQSTVYGEPAVVLIKGTSGRWHITGPVDQVATDDLIRLAEGLRLLAEGRGKPPQK